MKNIKFIVLITLLLLLYSILHSRTLDEIISSGVLKIGAYPISSVFEVIDEEKNEYFGFNYDLAKSFADHLGVDLEVVIIQPIGKHFYKDGVVPENVTTDESIVYTPDIFRDNVIDIATDILTVLPWRKRLFDFIPILANKQIIFARNNTIIHDIDIDIESKNDISNISFIIQTNTSFEKNFIDNLEPMIKGVEVIYTEENYEYVVERILSGKSDFGLIDAITFMGLNKINNRRLMFCIGVTRKEQLAWAIEKDNQELKEELEKFIQNKVSSNYYNKIFQKNFGVSYNLYRNIILQPLQDKTDFLNHSLLLEFF